MPLLILSKIGAVLQILSLWLLLASLSILGSCPLALFATAFKLYFVLFCLALLCIVMLLQPYYCMYD